MDDVPEEVKQERAERIMEIQGEVSETINASLVGKILTVGIDRCEEEYYVGRTEYDSPEVDPEVLISSERILETGNFYDVEIVGADGYDLYAKLI